MTYVKDVFGRDLFRDFDRVFVGFDDHFNRLARVHDEIAKAQANYPPYNIKKTGETSYVIEIAAAGFNQSEIDIELTENRLVVKGNPSPTSEPDQETFLHKGISARSFTRQFTLDDQVVVKNADMQNGMLRIFLERVIPEAKLPRKIAIGESKPLAGNQTLLTE